MKQYSHFEENYKVFFPHLFLQMKTVHHLFWIQLVHFLYILINKFIKRKPQRTVWNVTKEVQIGRVWLIWVYYFATKIPFIRCGCECESVWRCSHEACLAFANIKMTDYNNSYRKLGIWWHLCLAYNKHVVYINEKSQVASLAHATLIEHFAMSYGMAIQ